MTTWTVYANAETNLVRIEVRTVGRDYPTVGAVFTPGEALGLARRLVEVVECLLAAQRAAPGRGARRNRAGAGKARR